MAKYKATAESGVGFVTPKAADNTRKIQEQGDAYIRQLQAIRERQTAIELTNLEDYKKTLDNGSKWASEVNDIRRQQAMSVAQLKVESLKQQQQRSETITGTKSNFEGGTTAKKWLDFVTGLSETAGNIYKDYQAEKEKQDKIEGRNLAALFPHTSDQAGFIHQMGSSTILSADADTMAAVAESQGANAEAVEAIRAANPTRLNALKHVLSIRAGQFAVQAFNESLTKDNDYTVIINGEEVPLNEIPQDSKTLTKAWTQFMPEYFDRSGFGTASNQFLTAGASIAQQSWTEWMGGIREEENKAAQANRDLQAQTIFDTEITIPDNAIKATLGYFNYQFNQAQGNYSTAITSTLDRLADTAVVTDAQFEAALDTPMGDPNNPKDKRTIRTRFPQLVKDAREKRAADYRDALNAQSIERQAEADRLIKQLEQGTLADLGDNDLIDVDPEVLQQKAGEYRLMGSEYEPVATALEALIPQTVSKDLDRRLIEQWTEAEANGSLTTWMVMSSGASKEVKREWRDKANASTNAMPDKKSVDKFKKYSEVTLRERVKFAPGSGQVQGRDLALKEREALAQFQLDYRDARLANKSEQEAYDYAEGKFNTEFDRGAGDNATGRYALTGEEYKDVNGVRRPGRYTYDLQTIQELENPFAPVIKAFREMPASQAIKQPLVSEESLEAIVEQAESKGMIPVMPPMVVHMSDISGGAYSPLQILEAQLKARGLQLPEEVVRPASMAQLIVNPEMQRFLNYKPSITRTDIAVTDSGLEPIYAISTPMQEEVKKIFSSRESPSAGYDAINRGLPGDTPGGAFNRYGRKLTEMTLGQVKQLQAQELNAVGKYQFIESTLAEAAEDAGITDDMLFSEDVQDRIFFVHLDKYGAYGPWEQWWIQQGGPDLALTDEEKRTIEAFRAAYDPSTPWRQPKNLNPELIRSGIIVPEEPIEGKE